jgi:hypothetical protein
MYLFLCILPEKTSDRPLCKQTWPKSPDCTWLQEGGGFFYIYDLNIHLLNMFT